MGKDNIFNNPKPLGLLKHFLEMGSQDDIVLDFFCQECWDCLRAMIQHR